MENGWTKRIKEFEAEVAKLIAERDADRRREYGYSQQTVDALTLERDKLRAERNDWKARYQSVSEMHDALIAEFNEMRAENKRLREALDGIITVAKIICNEFPVGTASLYGWVLIGEQALKEASDE